MRSEASSLCRPFRALIAACLALVPLPALAQSGGAFGLDAKGLSALLAGTDVDPVLALADSQLADTGAYGSSAYYYLARWLDSRQGRGWQAGSAPEEARARLLYGMAFDRASSSGPEESRLVRREAGLALVTHLVQAGLWEELIAFTDRFAAEFGREWTPERARLEALDALGRDAELAALVARLKSDYPIESSKDPDALAYFGAMADLRSGGKAWPRNLRLILLENPASEWTARAFAQAQSDSRVRGLFREDELHALAMRDAVQRKDYAQALQEALLAADAAMGPTASRAMVADAGKAFLYADGLADHEALFVAQGWIARFYRARFARALERWDEASALFESLAAQAPTRADADASAWYVLECSYRGALASSALGDPSLKLQAEAAARRAQLDALVAASVSWSGPGEFLDLAGALYRDALGARDWALLQAMDARLGARLGPDMGARLAYTSCRAEELGSGPADADGGGSVDHAGGEARKGRYAAIAGNGAAPLFYRALAAWRAGLEPTVLRPIDSSPAVASGPASGPAPGEDELFVDGLAGFGLLDIAGAEARTRKAALGDEGLRRTATLFSSLGRPDQAARLEALLFSRPDFSPRRSDYELLYPRPYLSELRGLDLGSRVPEAVELGILRSESLFQADAISRSGAIGISQVMPATAAEQARFLGLSTYDLADPADNLAIGLSYYAALLRRSGGRPLRAMMAYNAGPSRLKAWAGAYGDLPDDLLVEALSLAETRQYCHNILQSAVVYGELYYGSAVGTTVESLVEGMDGGR